MKIENKNPYIFIIGGKAKSGKDMIADIICAYFFKKGQKSIKLKYAKYIRDYTKRITNWDGSEETKPRTFMQKIGTEVIRAHIKNDFFVQRMIEDIKVYSYFFNIIVISDARTIEEIEQIKNTFKNVISIYIERPHYDNGLTEEEKNHSTELELEGYQNFDYKISNDKTKEKLEKEIFILVNQLK